jgi:ATP-dependent RNA helicase DeaD
MQHFHEAGIPQPILLRLEQMGFTTPTPIQAQAIPHALAGKDILGSAQTGTGKTGAFGIPLVAHLMAAPRGSALVLLPTRELAVQVMQTLQKFIGNTSLPTALLIGGEDMGKQYGQLRARPRLIVGTPGRINDHLTRGTLMLHDTNFLVLDEMDRMLDMGFGVQIDAIAKFLTAKRQTLMFSATLPDNIEKLAAKYLTQPVRISVGSTTATAANVSQEVIKLTDAEKYPRLLDELNARQGSIIVFVKTKYGADRMAGKLRKIGHKAEALHGDLRQSRRDRVIKDFRAQHYRILIATDIAARGLDIPHIEHVINYDLPQAPEDYIHRIGRTARAGAEGAALNLVSPEDQGKWRAIHRMLNPGEKPEPHPSRGPSRHNGKPHSGGDARSDKPRRRRPQHWQRKGSAPRAAA